MYWDVLDVKADKHLNLSVRFADGTQGTVRFTLGHLTGLFAPLKEIDFFMQVFIDNGAVTWPGNLDLAPDAMYEAIKQKGEWVLD